MQGRAGLLVLASIALACGGGARPDAGVDAGFVAEPGHLVGACGAPAGQRSSPYAVLDVGHAWGVACLQRSEVASVTVDYFGRWALSRNADGVRVATGFSPLHSTNCVAALDLRNDMLAIGEEGDVVNVYSALTGERRMRQPLPSGSFGLSPDGRWLWVNGSTALEVFATSDGARQFSVSGDFSSAAPSATNDGLRVVRGSTLERFSLPTGTMVTSKPISGTFQAWFLDGAYFFSALGTTRWLTSRDGESTLLNGSGGPYGGASLGGSGDWMWTFNSSGGTLFRVDGGLNPVESVPLAAAGRTTFGVIRDSSVDVIRRGATGLSTSSFDLAPRRPDRIGLADDGSWLVSTNEGLVWSQRPSGGAPFELSCGPVLSVAGARNGLAAVSTASGNTMLLELQVDGGHVLRSTLALRSTQMELTGDGHTLVASSTSDAGLMELWIRDVSLGTANRRWVAPDQQTTMEFQVPRDAQRVALTINGAQQLVIDFDGRELLRSEFPTTFAPDGVHAFALEGSLPGNTKVFENGVFQTAFAGQAVAWLDNDRLLINFVRQTGFGHAYATAFDHAEIRDRRGALVESLALPMLTAVTVLPSGKLYDAPTNSIYDVTTGQTLWQAMNPGLPNRAAFNVVAGGFVVQVREAIIAAEPHGQ